MQEEENLSGEHVEIPKEYKGIVIGKGGDTLQKISIGTGARVIRKNGEVFIVDGTGEQKKQAKLRINQIIARARVRGVENEFNKICHYIDMWNLPENRKLKLEKTVQDLNITPGSQAHYRLKPAESYGPQESYGPNDDPNYLSRLNDDVMEALFRIKRFEMETKKYIKADMWCHFGKVMIQEPDKGEVARGKWTAEEVLKKFLRTKEMKYWKGAFKAGVNLDEKTLEENACEKTPEEYEDYSLRYDFTFVTPCRHQVRFKVWVVKRNLDKKLEDIAIPLTEDILEEVHFEEDVTRSRCRGWLVLPSRRFLQADILFPGCEFDCRLTIRGQTESAKSDYLPKEESRHVLSGYLSKLTFTDESGLHLPKENLPDGYQLCFSRCSKRALYEIRPGFTIIVSKESSYTNEDTTEESSESTDYHLHCREWDDLLNGGQWEPEMITEKLPEFFRFVKKVQGFVFHEMIETASSTRTIPPEILARGRVASEAYQKALADGKTSVRRVPIMLIGQDRAGKTSLKKSLKGICFDPEEDSTMGIEVDPSLFKVTTETWRPGTTDNEDNSDVGISFEYKAANHIVATLKRESQSTAVTRNSIDESSENPGSDLTKMTVAASFYKQAKYDNSIQATRDSAATIDGSRPHLSPDPKPRNQRDASHFTQYMPEEVAVITETLLQSEMDKDREEIFSTLWDFAGQSVYYETHPIFLTANAIYCLVYDLSLNPDDRATPLAKQGVYKKYHENLNLKTNFDYLDFWMRSVASLARCQDEDTDVVPTSDFLPDKLPPVFLVCTHADTPYVDSHPKKLAYEVLGRLKSKPYHSHLVDVSFVDNTKSGSESECSEVLRLRQEVLAIAHELPQTNKVIPIKWLAFVKALQKYKENGDKYISLDRAMDIASHCGINEDLEIKTLMDYLHDLRILIHFDDSPELNEIVILDPQWLIDVFKKVITVQPADQCKKKKILKLWEKLEKEGILDEKLLEHMWEPLFENRAMFDVLIAIMEKFTLLCPWPSDDESKSYLVPSMLKSQPPDKIRELVASAQIPSFFVKFENGHVPSGLFPRFVLQFFHWGKDTFLTPVKARAPQLFHNFTRFFVTTSEGEVCSVVFNCHTSTVEVAVLSEDHLDTAGFTYPRVVLTQVKKILEGMRNGFSWLRNMKYEMSVLCPVCCPSGEIDCCFSHDGKKCQEEQCLHFWSLSELCSVEHPAICTLATCTPTSRVQVDKFASWISSGRHQPLRPSTFPDTSQAAAATTDARPSDKTLKVTLLASEWGSSMGGLSTINRKLALLLSKNKQLNVTLLVPQSVCSEKEIRDAGTHNISIREAKSLPAYADPLDCLAFPPKDLAIDIVLGHGAKLGKQAQIIKDSHNCKWVQVVHTAPEELAMYKEYSEAIAKGEEKKEAEVALCELADCVVTIGPKLKGEFSSYLRFCKKQEDIIQLTPGIFHEFSTTEQATQECEKFKVLVFGRGDSEDFFLKGYDIAAKAVAKLKDSSCRLVFVGAPDGKQEEVKERLVQCGISKDQLVVRRFDPNEEKLKKLFCEVDLAIMPSRSEGFGLTALEALSAGLPVLVSRNSGFGEALRDLPSGKSFVVESEEPKEWAEAIASIRGKGREQRLKDMQTLRASYEEKYCWEDQCEALVEKMLTMVYGLKQLRA